MKKIGLTLSDKDYQIITKIAELNKVTATTICSLIIETRLSWYEKNEYLPKFGTFTYEQKMNKPKPQNKPNSSGEEISDEEMKQIMNDIFGSREEQKNDDDLPF